MSDYKETIDYLFNQLPVFQVIGPGAYKPGLETAYKLAQAFSNPHTAFKTIHVAGTNGKGSTSHMLASVLAEAGYKVGLYTSPHIFDFKERIRVNGEKISEDFVTDFVVRYRAKELGCNPSFFELTTIMAFDYFRSSGVDIAVIETGLGGRLDTTNIITPEVSVITNVSLDHTALLGNTVEEIAAEKAGIIKPGVPVIIGEDSGVREVFAAKAHEMGAPIVFAECHTFKHVTFGDHHIFSYRDGEMPDMWCELVGEFQVKNINTVLTALDATDLVDESAIRAGLANVTRNTGLLGRWTEIQVDGHRVILDTGHNPGAWQYLGPMLNDLAEKTTLRVVIGFSNDKDVNHIFKRLPKQAEYYFVTPSVKRGLSSSELLRLGKQLNLNGRAFGTVVEGFNQALADAQSIDNIFVGGSNFVVADLPV